MPEFEKSIPGDVRSWLLRLPGNFRLFGNRLMRRQGEKYHARHHAI